MGMTYLDDKEKRDLDKNTGIIRCIFFGTKLYKGEPFFLEKKRVGYDGEYIQLDNGVILKRLSDGRLFNTDKDSENYEEVSVVKLLPCEEEEDCFIEIFGKKYEADECKTIGYAPI